MNTTFEREIKNQNYTVMSNYHLHDKNLSLKAKGLLSQLLSYSPNWTLTIKGLCAVSKEQEKSITNTIKELEQHNYLTRQKLKDIKGRFYYKYIIHEKPKLYPDPQNLPVGNPSVEKDIQINTNIINTKEKDKIDKYTTPLNNNTINNKIIIDNNIILKQLIDKNYVSDDDLELYKYDELIRLMLSKYDFLQVIKITCYIINLYDKHKGLDENDNTIINKYGYYKEALINNLEKLNCDIDLDWNDNYEY